MDNKTKAEEGLNADEKNDKIVSENNEQANPPVVASKVESIEQKLIDRKKRVKGLVYFGGNKKNNIDDK